MQDIKNKTIEELKVMAYDKLSALEVAQAELREINIAIFNKQKE